MSLKATAGLFVGASADESAASLHSLSVMHSTLTDWLMNEWKCLFGLNTYQFSTVSSEYSGV